MSTPMTQMPFDVSAPAAKEGDPLDATSAFSWIRHGIDDFRQTLVLSLLYGFLFAGLCAGVYLLIRNVPWYTTGYMTGLVVAGPFLAAGLYTASRDIERGDSPGISASLKLIRQRRTYLGLFSLMLAMVVLGHAPSTP